MLGLSIGQVRGYVRSGFLSPERGPRGELRFSFSDIVLLRAAKGLLAARIGPRRIRRALGKLRAQLPHGRPLAGLRISSEGGRIVVADGPSRWHPDSGQALLDFEVSELARKVAPLARRAFRRAQNGSEPASAEELYEWGCQLESESPADAAEAYRRAIELSPDHSAAHVNLGRLLHEQGDVVAAESHYRRALQSRPGDPIAAFNLGVALEDLGRLEDALASYERSIALDPQNADAHYNAASVCEHIGRPAAALAHLKSYRTLTRPTPPFPLDRGGRRP
jgi:tetratricopeptide (TPR) repeat protein